MNNMIGKHKMLLNMSKKNNFSFHVIPLLLIPICIL